MRGLWHRLTEVALELVFPAHCVGCKRTGDVLCAACHAALQPVSPPFCDRCGRPLRDGASICRECRVAPLRVAGIRSAYRFEGSLRQAIHELKYGDLTALAGPLARLAFPLAESLRSRVDVALAVPLHPRRQRQRGYNQSELLAKELARLTSLPYIKGAVQRVRDTPSQVQMGGRAERRVNMRGAFRCQDPRVGGRRVLVVDDVCTTGSTLSACGEALYAAGAVHVWGLTIARDA